MYNDFYVGAGADVTVVAGCGVHTDNDGMAKHNGIHRFFLDRGAHVLYQEKHIGTGTGTGFRRIDPVTDIELGEDAVLEMDTIQIGGVDSTFRKTTAKLGARARLIIHERLMTDGEDTAVSDFDCDAGGRGFRCGSDFPVCCQRKFPPGLPIPRSAATAAAPVIPSATPILAENGKVNAAPELFAGDIDASLIHEAANRGKLPGSRS